MSSNHNLRAVAASLLVGAALTAVLVLFLGVGIGRAANVDVCAACTYTTIQGGVDAAVDGDVVRVAAGTFAENVVITKSVALEGGWNAAFTTRNPATTPSIIDSNDAGRGIHIYGLTLNVTVDGFEITDNDAGAGDGGGILVEVEDDSNIILHDNYIHENDADDGGGVYADLDNRVRLQLSNNDIMTNTATTDDYGGLYVYGWMSTTLIMVDNQINGNFSFDDYAGGRIELDNFANWQIEDNLFEGNTTNNDNTTDRSYGGLYFYAEYNGHGTFDRNHFIDNWAEDSYGGAYIDIEYNSSSSFHDNVFEGNTALQGSRGGLYLYTEYYGQITGSNLRVEGNTAQSSYGGADIEAEYNSSILLPGSRFVDNRSLGSSYGGFYAYTYDLSLIDLTDVYIYDNFASSSYGGGYLDAADGNDTIIATGAQVISNTANTGSAGGLEIDIEDGGSIDLSNSLFERNNADDYGGGLYVSDMDDGSTLLLNNSRFMTNTARTQDGGGAYFSYGPNYGSYLDISHAEFISNTAGDDGGGLFIDEAYYQDPTKVAIQGDHMRFERNTANDQGGGFYFYEGYEGFWGIFDYGTYISNTAGDDGGGFFMSYCYEGCKFSLSNSYFEDNKSTGNTDDGGGLYFYEAYYGAELNFDDNTFINNSAGYGGGAYIEYCYEGCEISISRNTFENNRARNGEGGGLYTYEFYYGSIAHIDDNVFLNNWADGDGGGFYNDYFAEDGAVGSFDRNVLRGNVSKTGDGGGFYSYDFGYAGATVSFSDNIVEDNQADGEGGGVYMYYAAYEGVELDFNRNSIQNNISGEDGGGLYMEYIEYGARARFNDNIISGNTISSTSSYDGGGMYIYDLDEGSILWMRDNQFNNNSATGDGGGIYWDDYIEYGSVLYFEDNQVNNNFAENDGGGLYFDDYWEYGNRIHFNRNQVNNNTAWGDYGGMYVYEIYDGTEVDMKDNQFNNNTATYDYGGVYIEYVEDGSVLRFWDNEVIGNRAGISGTEFTGGEGGGLWLDAIEYGSEVDMRRNTISGNRAYITGTTGGDYGGMFAYVYDGSLLTMEDNLVAENTADDSNGGVYIEMESGSRAVLEHNVIRANTAVTESGGLYIWGEDDSQYYLYRNQVVDNQAAMYGGVYVYNNDTTDPLWGLSENNLVANNTNGGVTLYEIDYRSRNDTIADNGPYGIHLTGTMTATVYLDNGIIWGNTTAFSSASPPTQTLMATYSDVQGGVLPGTGNISVDPLFVGGGSYKLQETSPAVNQVPANLAPLTDLEGIPRPVPIGGLADMGAYEWFRAGVTLEQDQAATQLPGTVVTYTFTVTNDGNLPDTFVIDVPINPLTWTVNGGSVNLLPGAATTVGVGVMVPSDAAGGVLNAMTVRATSQADGAVIDIAALDVTVEDVGGVSITPDLAQVAAPTVGAKYVHTLTNSGNFADSITLSGLSSQGWIVSSQPAVAIVPAGGSMPVTITVSVPPAQAAGLVDVSTITAASTASAGVTSDTATDTTTVAQLAGLELSPDNQGSGPGGTNVTYGHTVENTGNGTDTFNLSAVSSLGWTVTLSVPSVTVPAGNTANIQVTVSVPVGATVVDVTTVTAVSSYSPGVIDTATDTTQLGGKLYLPIINRN